MTKVIYKYEITDWNGTEVNIPMGYIIRHFGWQDNPLRDHGKSGNCFVWIEHEKMHAKVWKTEFRIFATGEEIPDGWQYVGTVQNDGMVWHCYRK